MIVSKCSILKFVHGKRRKMDSELVIVLYLLVCNWIVLFIFGV